MKISQLDEEFLKITDLENMLSLFIDNRGRLMFNLNETLYIDASESSLSTFICDHPMHWTTLSYRIYGTTRLAWLLCKVNNVRCENIFKAKQPGDKVLYLPVSYVDSIVSQLNDLDF
jgi:hypothetical protein